MFFSNPGVRSNFLVALHSAADCLVRAVATLCRLGNCKDRAIYSVHLKKPYFKIYVLSLSQTISCDGDSAFSQIVLLIVRESETFFKSQKPVNVV